MTDSESYYDETIAPALKAIATDCLSRGIPFFSAVEYAPGEIGATRALGKEPCLGMTMISHCCKTQPNIDAYIIGLRRYAKENDIDMSASLFLSDPELAELKDD